MNVAWSAVERHRRKPVLVAIDSSGAGFDHDRWLERVEAGTAASQMHRDVVW